MDKVQDENSLKRLEEFEKEVIRKVLHYITVLDAIGRGNPNVRVEVESPVPVLRQLAERINALAEAQAQFIQQVHEEAMDITEFFDILNRLNRGDYTARISERPRANEMISMMQDQINKLAQIYEQTAVESSELAICISQFIEVTEQVGRGNFKVEAPTDSSFELMAIFGNSINRMIKDLRNSYALIQKLSAPCLKVWDRVLVMPLVGTLTSDRAREIMEKILNMTVKLEARVAIIDVTGIPVMDTATADYLLKTVKAVKILGAEPIITGISPEIAGTIVKMGVELGEVTTKSTLAEGLKHALNIIEVGFVEKKG